MIYIRIYLGCLFYFSRVFFTRNILKNSYTLCVTHYIARVPFNRTTLSYFNFYCVPLSFLFSHFHIYSFFFFSIRLFLFFMTMITILKLLKYYNNTKYDVQHPYLFVFFNFISFYFFFVLHFLLSFLF